MYFSGKITNSALNFLNKQGLDLEGLFDSIDLPTEFMTDPTYWIESNKVENFLEVVEKRYCTKFPGENFFEKLGHSCADLKSWGALDSVLKMMPQPQDIFVQPDRFLSYFVSPAPPIGNLVKEDGQIKFDLPISTSEYPHVTKYLAAALEALPSFINSDMAKVEWDETSITLSWKKDQIDFFTSDKEGRNVNPEFMQSLVAALERAEKELEQKTKLVSEKDQLIDQLQVQSENIRSSHSQHPKLSNQEDNSDSEWKSTVDRLSELQSDVLRLNDYLARSHQLVTLLIGKQKTARHVKEAMRRVDWDYIKREYPQIVRSSCDKIESIKQNRPQDFLITTEAQESTSLRKTDLLLSDLIQGTIAKWKESEDIDFNTHFFDNRELKLNKKNIESALDEVFTQCQKSIGESGGKILVVTRPKGKKVEIEISDSGQGVDDRNFFSSSVGQKVIGHLSGDRGRIKLSGRSGVGTSFLIELPI